jgi:type VI secretion system protein VasD
MSMHTSAGSIACRTVRVALLVLAVGLMLAMVACASSAPKPVKTRLIVSVSADVNPDASGRASPIVVRVYQLKEDAAFRDGDFFAIFDREQATLAASLINRKEFTLAPGDERTVDFPVSGDAHYIAIAAAFRDIRNADWRVIKGAPKKGIKALVKTDSIRVHLEKERATLEISD